MRTHLLLALAIVAFMASSTQAASVEPTNVRPVPEPASLVLLGSGLAAASMVVRRRARR